ncbi:hypothetical protein H4Q26_000223 [Puccinia striiformis f. sp. tritici PST-130]|nr:hypothetical protein H4Q26_000223 [Puccinia striiformis f. sp. tritici PST-130]
MAPQAQRILRLRLKKEADTQSQDQPADENSTAPGYPNPYNQPDAMGREPTGQSPNSHARGKSKVTSTGYHVKCKFCTPTLSTQPGIINVSDDAQVYGLKKTTALPKNRFKKTTALPQNWFSKGHSGKFDSDEDDMVGSRLDNNHENTAPTGAINIKDLLHQIKLLKQEISDGDADFTGVVMTQREIRELNTKKEILCFTQERIGIDNSFRRVDLGKKKKCNPDPPSAGCQSLVGSYVSSTGDHGKFVIVEGPLLWTMKEGKWLVCQDVDRASDVSFIKCSISLGKTSIVEALARLSGKKLQRINLSDQTDLLDLYGADASVEGASPGQFERKDASLLDAFQKGDWVLLDEMNLAPQTVLEVRIIEDQPALNELAVQDEPRLGSSTSPVGRDNAGITLADLPRASSSGNNITSPDSSRHPLRTLCARGGNNKTKIKKKGIFGISLGVSIERRGVDSLMGAGAGKLRVLSFVEDCILAMKQMDMSVEGLFRKNGNIRCLKELTDAIDRDDSDVNLSDDNAVQLAALFKNS